MIKKERTLLISDIYKIYPIAWISKSKVLVDYFSSLKPENDILIADFASGEHDRVASFFVNLISEVLTGVNPKKRRVVYCIDLHALRLDSLFGKLEESNLLDNVRLVQAKLESMDTKAKLRPGMVEYLEENHDAMTGFDYQLRDNRFIPQETFDLGILNNDVVGYLHEYYKEYSDVALSLKKVHKTMKKDALLVVTMPCLLYVIDNLKILESLGFRYLDGKDVNLQIGSVSDIDRETDPQTMSRLGHYSFLIFVRN